MGLDCTHEAFHGAYSSFSRWRDVLARAAGYTFKPFDSPYGSREYVAEINWDALEEKNYQGEWDRLPEDPLIILLAHSDCDGYILPEHAPLLIDRLEQLLDKLPPDEEATGHLSRYGYRGTTERFIAGLRAAAVASERLEFW